MSNMHYLRNMLRSNLDGLYVPVYLDIRRGVSYEKHAELEPLYNTAIPDLAWLLDNALKKSTRLSEEIK